MWLRVKIFGKNWDKRRFGAWMPRAVRTWPITANRSLMGIKYSPLRLHFRTSGLLPLTGSLIFDYNFPNSRQRSSPERSFTWFANVDDCISAFSTLRISQFSSFWSPVESYSKKNRQKTAENFRPEMAVKELGHVFITYQYLSTDALRPRSKSWFRLEPVIVIRSSIW